MGTMHSPASVLQIPSLKCILRRRCFYPASATTTTITTAAAIATTIRARAGAVSTAPDSVISVANFLVDSLEFSTQEALSTSTKICKWRQDRGAKEVCGHNFYKNADLVIGLLQEKGLEKPQIKKLVTSTPRILTCRVQNLEPKMNYFQEVGFSVSELADIFSNQAGILYCSLDSAIRPAVEALREIMGGDEDVVSVIKGFKLNTLSLVTKHLIHNVSSLQAQGIPIESIRKRIRQHSIALTRKPATFKDMMARAEAQWGVSPHSTMFLYAIHVLGCLNEKNIESKCQVFESFGWDRSDVVDLFRRNPLCFGLSERKIKAALGFYMNQLGYDPRFIIKLSVLLGYSLEKRVFPRHLVLQLLKDKGLIGEDLAFHRAFGMNEPQFLNKYIRPFEDEVPNLHNIYVDSIGSSAHHQIEGGKNNPFSRMRLNADSARE